MKKIVSFCLIVIIICSTCISVPSLKNNSMNNFSNVKNNSIDDLSTTIALIKQYNFDELQTHYQNTNNKLRNGLFPITNMYNDYPMGEIIWQYTISTSYDNSPKAIASIPDVNDDGIDDVIICSEDDYVRCFDGGANGTGSVIWEHEITGGDIYSQKGLAITQDINDDGYNDLVVGACGGARLIRMISGSTGGTIWTHDTHEYGDGGWVYQVDCRYDFNDDDVIDVLAATGDDSTDTGPKRVYCLDGNNGVSIWEYPLGGPGFSVIGVSDFTGDGKPDVVAGASNEYETDGFIYGINGDTGNQFWSFAVAGSSVWALEQVDDVNSDGIEDIIGGDFSGNIYGLNANNGNQLYFNSLGTVIIIRFERINDVNNDGHPDIIPAHSTTHEVKLIDGYTGDFIWSHTVADQPWVVARISDVSGDGIDDVLVGTLFQNNYCYFLNGFNGSELASIYYGQAVDAIASISDVIGDGSMEMIAGGRDGLVTCFSGGTESGLYPQNVLITNLEQNWNFISLPFNYSINKTDLVVNYNNINYSWSDAVSMLYVNDFIFGWDRISQTYNFIDKLQPGFGCWVYSYEVCEVWVENLTIVYDSYITDVEQKWNIISGPYNESINKADILLKYLGIDYSWSDGVSMGLVSDFIFEWNRTLQYYDFTDALEPGYAQWLYAYQPCMLKRVTL